MRCNSRETRTFSENTANAGSTCFYSDAYPPSNRRKLAAIADHYFLFRPITSVCFLRFNQFHYIHTLKHLSKDHMPLVQPWRLQCVTISVYDSQIINNFIKWRGKEKKCFAKWSRHLNSANEKLAAVRVGSSVCHANNSRPGMDDCRSKQSYKQAQTIGWSLTRQTAVVITFEVFILESTSIYTLSSSTLKDKKDMA